VAYANFIPEVWSKKLLKVLNKKVVMANLVNSDFEGDIKGAGDTVYVRTFGNVTINNYTRDMTLTFETLTDPVQTMMIDQQKYFAFKVDDLDIAQADIDILEGYTDRAAIAIRDVVDNHLITLGRTNVDSGNIIGGTTPIALTKLNVYQRITELAELLDEDNVPDEDRHLVIPPKVKTLLLQSEEFTRATSLGDQVVQNGYIGNIAGFGVHVTTNMTVDAGSAWNIMAFNRDFISFASQVNQVERVRPFNMFSDAVKGLYLYGGKVFQPKCGAILRATV
jgi:N4-gp56 family major capsid protein